MDHVTSHRRIVKTETGQSTEVENAVKAENITHCGDLAETGVNINGEALLVGIDGTLRRTTMAAIQNWLQVSIQQGVSFKVPYVDDVTKTWMVYDPATGEYKDSGVNATGKVELEAIMGKAGGVATLDDSGKVPANQIPDPEKIGAAKESHGHVVKDISNFPTEMKPTAHASTHAADGEDPLAPGDIGAAKEDHNHTWGQVTGKPDAYPPLNHKHAWSTITGTPSAYPPAVHEHSVSDVTGAATPIGPETVTLYASQWYSVGPWWVLPVTVSGVTAEDTHLKVYPVSVIDNDARMEYEAAYARLDAAAAGNGRIEFVCRSAKPTIDLQVLVEGVRIVKQDTGDGMQAELPSNWYATESFYGVTVVKPCVTGFCSAYVGGEAQLTIQTHCKSSFLALWCGAKGIHAFVSPMGAMVFTGVKWIALSMDVVTFSDGVLTIKGQDQYINSAGVFYSYQVL